MSMKRASVLPSIDASQNRKAACLPGPAYGILVPLFWCHGSSPRKLACTVPGTIVGTLALHSLVILPWVMLSSHGWLFSLFSYQNSTRLHTLVVSRAYYLVYLLKPPPPPSPWFYNRSTCFALGICAQEISKQVVLSTLLQGLHHFQHSLQVNVPSWTCNNVCAPLKTPLHCG